MATTLTICPRCDSLNRLDTERALRASSTCGKCGTPLALHGLVSEVSAAGFRRILAKSERPVVVDFGATWCGPCKMYGPVFERASTQNRDAVFLKIDTDRNPDLANELGIRGVPTTVVFKGGREAGRQSGVLPEPAIAQMLR